MKRKYLLLSFAALIVLTVMNTTKVKSNKTFPPIAHCNDPSSNMTCVTSGCHGGTNQAVTAQNLLLRIGTDSVTFDTLNAGFKYVAGQKYYISFSVLALGVAFGFQTIATDVNGNPVGTFAITSPHTKLLAGYMSHLIATQGYNTWLFQWTAPAAASTGPVTFYYAFNAADSAYFGNYINATPDNNIFVGTTTIQPTYGASINNIADKISGLEVYPNPVNGAFNISFDLKQSGISSAVVYSVDGRLCKELFNENLSNGSFSRNYDISSLSAGIYLVKLNVDGASTTTKIIKE